MLTAKNVKAVKMDKNESILLKVKTQCNKELLIWADIWKEGTEILFNWNQYIFHENNSKDMEVKQFQENSENFDLCYDAAIEFFASNQ